MIIFLFRFISISDLVRSRIALFISVFIGFSLTTSGCRSYFTKYLFGLYHTHRCIFNYWKENCKYVCRMYMHLVKWYFWVVAVSSAVIDLLLLL